MGNAPEQVIQAADQVTGTIHEAGAAEAIRRYLLESCRRNELILKYYFIIYIKILNYHFR
jgi:hypothetical protein